MADSDRIWRAKVGGTTYELTQGDLTAGILRQMKQWYGREFGAFLPFVQLLASGDVDAISCALWITKKKVGEKVGADPSFVNFTVGQFESIEDEEDDTEAQEGDPTPEGETTLA